MLLEIDWTADPRRDEAWKRTKIRPHGPLSREQFAQECKPALTDAESAQVMNFDDFANTLGDRLKADRLKSLNLAAKLDRLEAERARAELNTEADEVEIRDFDERIDCEGRVMTVPDTESLAELAEEMVNVGRPGIAMLLLLAGAIVKAPEIVADDEVGRLASTLLSPLTAKLEAALEAAEAALLDAERNCEDLDP